jgi:hypothetical protein
MENIPLKKKSLLTSLISLNDSLRTRMIGKVIEAFIIGKLFAIEKLFMSPYKYNYSVKLET